MAIQLKIFVHGDTEDVVRIFVVEDERHLTLGTFSRDSYPSEAELISAAKACQAHYEATPWVSPFVTHRKVILASYGAAQKLAELTLSLFNGNAYPLNCSRAFSSLDAKHFDIAIELISSYGRFGENDRDFLRLADELRGIEPATLR